MEKKEKKEIVIKKTAQHTAGTKYLERATEGEINAPVYLRESKGKVEATIDDEAIGFVVGMKPEEMPGKYDCHITGLGEKANTFAASITMHPASGSSVSGKIATFSKEIEAAEKASGLSDVADRVQVMLDNRVKPCVIRATLGDYHKVENPHIPSAIYKDTRNENEESILNQAVKRDGNFSGVVLTTAHSSKGLEWPVIINSITGYDQKGLSQKAVEGKRRLLFVSSTRARDELYITGQYRLRGKTPEGEYVNNRFLKESYAAVGKEFAPRTAHDDKLIRLEAKKKKKAEEAKTLKAAAGE